MNLRIKLIPALIFFSLIFVFLYQIYWLNSFYEDQSAQMEVDIMTSLRNADYKEIYMRLALIQTQQNDSVRKNTDTEFPVEILEDVDAMLKYFQRGLHQSAGNVKKVDFPAYNNLLQIELTQKGIMLESFTEMIDLRTNETLECIPKDTSKVERADYKAYVFPFDTDGNYAYRLNIKQPRLFVLKQMSGILGTSLLMIVCLLLSYIYLLKTIYKQKSLDEIKSDFVNNMTHELKTPISIAYAVTDALQNYGMMDDPAKRDEYLKISKEQLTHLNGLVEQILIMSVEERKNMKLSLESISLLDLFNHVKTQYLLNAPKKVTIDISVEPENLVVKVDKIHFQNVIGNLIENSIKYSGEQVTISLTAEKENTRTLIQIKDNGIGISQASLHKIFDKFYRISTGNIHDVKGYGLGLFYVKTIVEKHGGAISVESKPEEGTLFNIYL